MTRHLRQSLGWCTRSHEMMHSKVPCYGSSSENSSCSIGHHLSAGEATCDGTARKESAHTMCTLCTPACRSEQVLTHLHRAARPARCWLRVRAKRLHAAQAPLYLPFDPTSLMTHTTEAAPYQPAGLADQLYLVIDPSKMVWVRWRPLRRRRGNCHDARPVPDWLSKSHSTRRLLPASGNLHRW